MHLISSAAIIIGMSIFILGTSLINGLDEQTIREQELIIGGEIIFHPSEEEKKSGLNNLRSIQPELQSKLQSPEVEAWTGRTIFLARLTTGKHRLLTRVNGYTLETDKQVFPRDRWKIQGKEPNEAREIAIGSILAEKLNVNIGDSLTLEVRTKDGALNAIEYQCSGIIKTGAFLIDSMMLWLPMASVEELIQIKDSYSQISVQVQGNRSKVKDFLSSQLATDWIGSTATQEVKDQLAVNKFRRKAITFVSGLLLFIAALGLNNTMMMLCFKRRKEVGVLRALGVSSSQVISLFSLEGSLLGLFSGGAACTLGGGLSYYFSIQGIHLSGQAEAAAIPAIIYTQFSPQLLLFVCLFSTVLATLASFLPISLLLRQSPNQLLKTE